ncbi:MAG: dihydroorotase [Lachnoclostridium sp.]|nr:dihydroorotase [Lachnoclostridium sp.]
MILLYNATIVNESQRYVGYVAVESQYIKQVGHGEAPQVLIDAADEAVDLGGNLLMPGVIDTHVHFRDPGLTAKGDMATETVAAVMGGVTSFLDMPNTIPPTVSRKAIDDKKLRAAEVSLANYGFFIGATNDNEEEILQADFTGIAGVKVFMGSSTGNMLVDDESTLDRVFREVKVPVAVHAEDNAIIKANIEAIAAEYPDGDIPVDRHPDIRSSKACVSATAKAVEIARKYGTHLHVCHISTADELQFFTRGDLSAKKITAETCPHYLFFDRNDYDRLRSRIKCNPAIKECSDRLALLKAVIEGRIDTIATDHAPHLLESKAGNALTAASGMPGIEFSLALMLELADENPSLTEERIVELMCHNPARIFNIDRRGFIREGYFADLVVVGQCSLKIKDEDVHSRCGWTPLAGTMLRRRPVMTMVNGRVVMSGGRLTGDRPALPLKFNNQ